jgi:hypothetical protein
MNSHSRIQASFLAALLLLAGAPLLAGEAHVHGQALLEISVEGDLLTVRFESPLDNLLGFERAPRNEHERKAVRGMATKLHDSAALLLPSPAAECIVLDTRLSAPLLGSELLAAQTRSAPAAAEKPAARQVKNDDEHAELSATWRFRCARPDALHDLTLKLFATFTRLRRIDAVAVGNKGQRAARLSASQPQMRW